MDVLVVSHLSKHYKKKGGQVLKAVDDISFVVRSGEVVGVLGPNGAGKSTTIKMVAGQATPTAGEVFILGHSVTKERQKAMRFVGGVIESPDLYLDMTGLQNLRYLASLHPRDTMVEQETEETKTLTKKQMDERRIADVLKMVGLTERKNEKVRHYSLGMKQRLGIAQALLSKPKLLILDEPANGLDPSGIREIRVMLKMLASEYGMAVMVSSHQLAEMQLLCDRVLLISGGQITMEKNMDALTQDAAGKVAVEVRISEPSRAAEFVKERFGTEVVVEGDRIRFRTDNDTSNLTRELVLAGFNVYGVQEQPVSLEDIFFENTHAKQDIKTPEAMGLEKQVEATPPNADSENDDAARG